MNSPSNTATEAASAPRVRLRLHPLGRTVAVERGVSLQEVLFAQGVEFPCGGQGRCQGCRVRVLAGALPVTEEDARRLSGGELAEGWRLACQARASADLSLEVGQWETPVLADDSTVEFTPREGLGVAVDVGTTTLVAQLLDLRTGNVLAVRTALNAQSRHGADVMSRVEFALREGGQPTLQQAIRGQIGQMIAGLLADAGADARVLKDIVLVGNTVMHHLFCGRSVEPLAHHPFWTPHDGLAEFTPDVLGWKFTGAGPGRRPARATVRFLPCLGSFVGSDLLAGVLATKLHEADAPTALVDLGTNGEIVVGGRGRLLCASTAAGPAFEGARVSMGMRAATGAIAAVTVRGGRLHCRVLGSGPPRGICGSGLVDAVAAGLELKRIQPSGRLRGEGPFALTPPVVLTQRDVRELQLAKAAIAAGLRVLLGQWGADANDLTRLYLAGAFGNYINRASARRIGLLPLPPERVQPVGNAALRGAKLALFSLPAHDGSYAALRARVRQVALNEDPQFAERFAAEMRFPG